MIFEEFEILQKQLFTDIEKIGAGKGKEYASSDDRLANFKRLALELELSPEKVAYIYFKKHLDSIQTYLKVGHELSEESIRGRFLDAINYLTLIYGLIVESKKNTPEYIRHRPDLIPFDNRTMIMKDNVAFWKNQIWSESDIGPVCIDCSCSINKGQEYIRNETGSYRHRFHYDKTATQETSR